MLECIDAEFGLFSILTDGDRMIIIIAVISIAPYLNDKGELTALYRTNSDVYVKSSKIINYSVITL